MKYALAQLALGLGVWALVPDTKDTGPTPYAPVLEYDAVGDNGFKHTMGNYQYLPDVNRLINPKGKPCYFDEKIGKFRCENYPVQHQRKQYGDDGDLPPYYYPPPGYYPPYPYGGDVIKDGVIYKDDKEVKDSKEFKYKEKSSDEKNFKDVKNFEEAKEYAKLKEIQEERARREKEIFEAAQRHDRSKSGSDTHQEDKEKISTEAFKKKIGGFKLNKDKVTYYGKSKFYACPYQVADKIEYEIYDRPRHEGCVEVEVKSHRCGKNKNEKCGEHGSEGYVKHHEKVDYEEYEYINEKEDKSDDKSDVRDSKSFSDLDEERTRVYKEAEKSEKQKQDEKEKFSEFKKFQETKQFEEDKKAAEKKSFEEKKAFEEKKKFEEYFKEKIDQPVYPSPGGYGGGYGGRTHAKRAQPEEYYPYHHKQEYEREPCYKDCEYSCKEKSKTCNKFCSETLSKCKSQCWPKCFHHKHQNNEDPDCCDEKKKCYNPSKCRPKPQPEPYCPRPKKCKDKVWCKKECESKKLACYKVCDTKDENCHKSCDHKCETDCNSYCHESCADPPPPPPPEPICPPPKKCEEKFRCKKHCEYKKKECYKVCDINDKDCHKTCDNKCGRDCYSYCKQSCPKPPPRKHREPWRPEYPKKPYCPRPEKCDDKYKCNKDCDYKKKECYKVCDKKDWHCHKECDSKCDTQCHSYCKSSCPRPPPPPPPPKPECPVYRPKPFCEKNCYEPPPPPPAMCPVEPECNGKDCPHDLKGHYICPYDIVSYNKRCGYAEHRSYKTHISENTSAIFSFNIPESYKGKTCTLIFLLPKQPSIPYNIKGEHGYLGFDILEGDADSMTCEKDKPQVLNHLNDVQTNSGDEYTVYSIDQCYPGKFSFEVTAKDLSLTFTESSTPKAVGLYIRAC